MTGKVYKVTRAEIDEAISRVQHGTSTLEDGNLLRAWSAGVWRLLETAWAADDAPIELEHEVYGVKDDGPG